MVGLSYEGLSCGLWCGPDVVVCMCGSSDGVYGSTHSQHPYTTW